MSDLFILDASAILAFLQEEPGGEHVEACLKQPASCWVTAANQAEIIAKALDRGVLEAPLKTILDNLAYQVIAHPPEDGERAGYLRLATRKAGLSLGDRLCLAAAMRLKATVITADRPWLALAETLQLDIRCIRPDQH